LITSLKLASQKGDQQLLEAVGTTKDGSGWVWDHEDQVIATGYSMMETIGELSEGNLHLEH
jgi:hypothetical protein